MERLRNNPEQERREAFEKGELYGAQTTRALIEKNMKILSKDECAEIQERITRETLNPMLQARITDALDILMDQDKLNKYKANLRDLLGRSLSTPDLAALLVEGIPSKLEPPAVEDLKTLELNDPKIQSSAINYDMARGMVYVTSRILCAGELMKGTFEKRFAELASTDGGGYSQSYQTRVKELLDRQNRESIHLLEQDPTGKSMVEKLVDGLKSLYEEGSNEKEFGVYGARFTENAYNAMYPIAEKMNRSTD